MQDLDWPQPHTTGEQFICILATYPLLRSQLHEENELVWNDGVAPETALDFDAPNVSAARGLVWWLGGFVFFYSVWSLAKATGHPDNKPSVRSRACAAPGDVVISSVACHSCGCRPVSPMQASRALPESTKTTALGNYSHGKY